MTYLFTEPGKEDISITKSYSLLNDSVDMHCAGILHMFMISFSPGNIS